ATTLLRASSPPATAGSGTAATKVLVLGRDRPYPLGGLFRSQISLRLGQKLEADHELAHRRRTQERGVDVRVELPGVDRWRVRREIAPVGRRVAFFAEGRPVPAEGVREGCGEE